MLGNRGVSQFRFADGIRRFAVILLLDRIRRERLTEFIEVRVWYIYEEQLTSHGASLQGTTQKI